MGLGLNKDAPPADLLPPVQPVVQVPKPHQVVKTCPHIWLVHSTALPLRLRQQLQVGSDLRHVSVALLRFALVCCQVGCNKGKVRVVQFQGDCCATLVEAHAAQLNSSRAWTNTVFGC